MRSAARQRAQAQSGNRRWPTEARALGAGRLLALNLHLRAIGQPHRIRHLERVLAHRATHRAAIWNAAPSAIIDAALAQ